jgi:quercetin dioxygenase-like cupin family protein
MKSAARPVLAIVFSSFALGSQPDDKVVPVHQEPRHHLVFESAGTRILDVQVPPGDTTLYHTHSDPILYVAMSASQTRSQTLGREWSGSDASQRTEPVIPRDGIPRVAPVRPGRMTSTTSYATAPLTHRVNNLGQALFRLIGITNSSAGDHTAAPSAGFDQMPEISNPWFRGYRWTLGVTPSEHRHANPVALVLVSGRAVARGPAATTLDTPGAFAWIEGDVAHTIQALGDAMEVVEVEVRRPR